jgi:hypothetical protein
MGNRMSARIHGPRRDEVTEDGRERDFIILPTLHEEIKES